MIRGAYLKRIENRLRDLREEIDRLRPRAEKLTDDTRGRLLDQIAALGKAEARIRARLRDVTEAGAGSWGVLKSGIDTSVAEMKKSIDDLVDKIRKSA